MVAGRPVVENVAVHDPGAVEQGRKCSEPEIPRSVYDDGFGLQVPEYTIEAPRLPDPRVAAGYLFDRKVLLGEPGSQRGSDSDELHFMPSPGQATGKLCITHARATPAFRGGQQSHVHGRL